MTDAGADEWTVARHIAGKPAFAVELYDRFIATVEDIGRRRQKSLRGLAK